MRVLPTVLHQQSHAETGQVILELDIPASLPHFVGHFPGHPILAGVVQLDWAIAFARQFFQIPADFKAVEKLKFNAPVLPECQITLTLDHARLNPSESAVIFSYRKGVQAVSSGRVVFTGKTDVLRVIGAQP